MTTPSTLDRDKYRLRASSLFKALTIGIMLLMIGMMNLIRITRMVALQDGTIETSAMFCLS
jgi:hypothetical protein